MIEKVLLSWFLVSKDKYIKFISQSQLIERIKNNGK
tara:strand:+ start:999 stop:1106 length:108 start_codon:yes stop_codon:yes gene_type:complete